MKLISFAKLTLLSIFCFTICSFMPKDNIKNGGILKGKITTTDLKPLKAAIIIVSTATRKGTDEEGNYSVSHLLNCNCEVLVVSSGYNSFKRTVKLEVGKTTIFNAKLSLASQP